MMMEASQPLSKGGKTSACALFAESLIVRVAGAIAANFLTKPPMRKLGLMGVAAFVFRRLFGHCFGDFRGARGRLSALCSLIHRPAGYEFSLNFCECACKDSEFFRGNADLQHLKEVSHLQGFARCDPR